MKISKILKDGKEQILLEVEDENENDLIKDFGRPWEKFKVKIRENRYPDYSMIIIEKETL